MDELVRQDPFLVYGPHTVSVIFVVLFLRFCHRPRTSQTLGPTTIRYRTSFFTQHMSTNEIEREGNGGVGAEYICDTSKVILRGLGSLKRANNLLTFGPWVRKKNWTPTPLSGEGRDRQFEILTYDLD